MEKEVQIIGTTEELILSLEKAVDMRMVANELEEEEKEAWEI